MKNKNKVFNSLFWRISGVFLIIMAILAALMIRLSVNYSNSYFSEAQQRINANIAEGALKEVNPFFINGEVNKEAIHTIMHSMMAVHPSIEVYLLDTDGKILTYVVPYKEVKSNHVKLKPILEFIENKSSIYIKGDDPRNPGEEKVFSAAPIYDEQVLMGYLYIILASQEYTTTMTILQNSFILKFGTRTMLLIFLFATIAGFISILFITRNLNHVMKVVRDFKEGNLGARIHVRSKGEVRQLAETFNSMAGTIEDNIEELKSVEALRKELIANVSHDLRSPIASIQGFAETILIKKDSIKKEELHRYLKAIENNTQNLNKLVNDLFELSKLETNSQKVSPEPTQLAELVQDVAEKFRILAQKKSISINTIYSKNLPLAFVDISLIDRVFQNIIDNAIKYCKESDSILIELDVQQDEIQVRVKDTGAGISEKDLPHIFSRYYKGAESDSFAKGSTGLGLAIVRKILELHNSTIKVFSELNKGTTFEFGLPLYKAS